MHGHFRAPIGKFLSVSAVLATACWAAADGDAAASPVTLPANILATLTPGHPRLLVRDNFAAAKALIRNHEAAAGWYARVKRGADGTLTRPASTYQIPDGKRLLNVSRRVKARVYELAFAYVVERDARYLERLWTELEGAAAFQDWNPRHFLDTAEMTHAFAIAYDWLYDAWSPERRRAIREAMIRLGLTPALAGYRGEGGRKAWWARGWNNWNQVCNGGIGTGALAIADEEPALAAEILRHACEGIQIPMRHYAPDGAGTEGVGYWSYGTSYNLLFLASLESALGTDFGLSRIEGFDRTGDHPLYMAGAGYQGFNFADCGRTRTAHPQHFWLARRFGRPQYAWYRSTYLSGPRARGEVLDILWFDDSGKAFDPATLAPDKHFRRAECASMRSSWTDPDAWILGIQAGDNRDLGGHRHLDLGTFILDAFGQRWALDLGSERQTYLSHQHSFKRWEFYRIRAEGHNTLVIDPRAGPDQAPGAVAPIVQFESSPARAVAVVDLTQAYSNQAQKVHRTFEMLARKQVVVSDEIVARAPAQIWWFMHTQAQIELSADQRTATLRQKDKELTARLATPPDATFQVMDAVALPGSPNPDIQKANKGVRKLAIRLTDVKNVRLSVRFGGE
ncbi:MAG: heparinase II/III family protein [Kiritimatiellae bacterium]|nr:heparinase II/III family protein [Kiritimatiellia bacterium]